MNYREEFETSPQRIRNKRMAKRNRNRLILIFLVTFFAVFFICVTIASMFAPTVDIASSNEEDKLSHLTSSDFKAKVDERLKAIEMADNGVQTGNSSLNPMNGEQQTNVLPNEGQLMQNPSEMKKAENKLPQYEEKKKNSSEVRNDFRIDDNEFTDQSAGESPTKNNPPVRKNYQEQSSTKVSTASTPARKENPPIPSLEPERMKAVTRTAPESSTVSKVIVGRFETPTEARDAARRIMETQSGVIPFVRQVNGVYAVQVGSFSSREKVRDVVDTLRSNGYSNIRVVEE